jgi:hypothetical protein
MAPRRRPTSRRRRRWSLFFFKYQCSGSGSALILVGGIRIMEDKNDPQKLKKVGSYLYDST